MLHITSSLNDVFRPLILMNSKRKARESSNSSASGASPVEKRARELNSSSSPERSTKVFEMSLDALESKLDLILKRLETMDSKLEEINTTVSNLESKFNILEGRVEKLENDQSSTRTALQELQDGLQEFNTQVNEATAAREKASEFCENRYKELEKNCCMLKCIKGEKICVSTALARKKKAETVAWCLVLSWNSNVESKQKVSNFSGSTGSERLMMMEALEQLSLGFLDIATEKQFFQKQSR